MTWHPEPEDLEALHADLKAVRKEARWHAKQFGDSFDGIDVRLRVHGDDQELLEGDSQFDQDHRGFWGSGSVGPDDSDAALLELAEDLIAQVLDAQAESEAS